jgi:hypothetical protein
MSDSDMPPDGPPQLPAGLARAVRILQVCAWFFGSMVLEGVLFAALDAAGSNALVGVIKLGSVPLGVALLVVLGTSLVHAPEKSIAELVGLRPLRWPAGIAAVACGAALGIPNEAWSTFVYRKWPLTAAQSADLAELFSLETARGRMAVVVTLAVLHPLAQELLFRGVWAERLLAVVPRFTAGAVLVALALVPALESPRALATLAPLVVLCTVLRLTSRTLWLPLLVQCGQLLVTVVPLLFKPSYEPPAGRVVVALTAVIGGVLTVFLASRVQASAVAIDAKKTVPSGADLE